MTTNHDICARCSFSERGCGGPCACTVDGRDILDHASAGDCPHGYYSGAPQPRMNVTGSLATAEQRQAAEQREAERLAAYHALWAEIHGRPKWLAWVRGGLESLTAEDAAAELAFLAKEVPARLPGCSCGGDWARLLAETPPDLASPIAYFDWTVQAHNAVSRRLGKQEMPLAAARKEHGWPAPTTDDRTAPKAASIDV